ncbi:MAG: RNA polymerase sigma factor [Actinomycetota bacterium]
MCPEAAVDEPDPQTVAAARGGDLRAFEALVRRYQPDVWRLCFHLVRDETAADDITQDAFVRAYRFLSRFRGDSKFSTWLLSIARNCALDELRRAGRRRRLSDRLDAQPAAHAGDPTTGVEVREALAGLPLELRESVVLIDMFGVSYREAGRVLDLPEGTVKSRVHRAREQLVQALAPSRTRSTREL